MARGNKHNISADTLKGEVREKDGRNYLDTGIGLHIETDNKAGNFISVDYTDCDECFWNDIQKKIASTNERYKELEDSIRAQKILYMSVLEGQESKIEIFRKSRRMLDYLYLRLEDFPIRFKIRVTTCTAQELHDLFEGGKIAVRCLFEDVNLTLLKPDMDIIVTPVGRSARPANLIPGETYTGYVKNWTPDDGIFIYCEGNEGLLKGTNLKGASYKEDFKAGKICEEYPIGSRIDICVLGIDKNKNSHKSLINMALKGAATVKDMAEIGQVLDLRICDIYLDKSYMMVNHLGHRCIVLMKGKEYIPFRQRVENHVYHIDKKIRVKVYDKNIESGKISFVLNDIYEDYGIRIGESLPAQIRDGELYVRKDGREWHFEMVNSINQSNEIRTICKDICLDIMAECVEILPSGEPRFSIDTPIRNYLAGLDDGTIIDTEIIGASDILVAWKYDSIFGGIKIEEAGFLHAIPASFTKGSTLRLRVNRSAEDGFLVSFADVVENPWNEIADLKIGDEISVELVKSRKLNYGYCFRYSTVTGVIGTTECPQAKNGVISVKVVHIDAEKQLLYALPCDRLPSMIPQKGEITVSVLKYICHNLFWVKYAKSIYIAHLSNDYPKYVQQYLLKEGLPVKVNLIEASGTSMEISLPYIHDAISEFSKNEGDVIYPVIEGSGPEGFILKTIEGLFCLLPYQETSWCSDIYIDHNAFPAGNQISVRIISLDGRKIIVSSKSLTEDPWLRADIQVGNTIECVIAGRRTTDRSLVIRYGDLYGLILWEDTSWFDFKGINRFPVGTSVSATVISFDPESRDFKLSMTALSENPWEKIGLIQDSVYTVTVKEVYESCAIVTTEEGHEGFIPLESLTHLGHTDCRKVVEVGNTFDAVLSLSDPVKRYLEFDRKSLIPSIIPDTFRPGDIVDAVIINIAVDKITLDINGTPGCIPSVTARQFIKGAEKNADLKDIFTVGETRKVKICRIGSGVLYATYPEGVVYDEIGYRSCRITNILDSDGSFRLETDKGNKVILPFGKASWSRYARYEHHIGELIEVNLCGFCLQNQDYAYKAERKNLLMNPWIYENYPPEAGDLMYVTVIAIDSGKIIVSDGRFTAPLSHPHLLTEMPWIIENNDIASIKEGDRVMVRVSRIDKKERDIGFVPYPDSNGLDKKSCLLVARHIVPEGIYAYCTDYDWFCFVPKDEIYWSPLGDARGHMDIGEEFFAEQIAYNEESGLFNMSIRNLLAKPNSSIKIGDNVSGTVSKITSDSIVARFDDLDGVINTAYDSVDPAEYCVGQDVRARVLERSASNELTFSLNLAKGFSKETCPYKIGQEHEVKITSVNPKSLTVICPEFPFFHGTVTGLPKNTSYMKGALIKVVISEISFGNMKFSAKIPLDERNKAENNKNDNDGFYSLAPGKQVWITYYEDIDGDIDKHRVTINRDIECTCISRDKIKKGYITDIDFMRRLVTVSEECPDMEVPQIGTVVKCHPKSYDSTTDTLHVWFVYKQKYYEGCIPSRLHDWMRMYSDILLNTFDKNRTLYITAAITSTETYILDAKNHISDPMADIKNMDKVSATIIKPVTEGYIILYKSIMGLVPYNELAWQHCDLKMRFWGSGDSAKVMYMNTDPNTGYKIFSHRQATDNPFIGLNITKGQEYSATVKRIDIRKQFMVVELNGTNGIEASVKPNTIKTLSKPGTKITKIRIEDIWPSDDPTLHGRISVSILKL